MINATSPSHKLSCVVISYGAVEQLSEVRRVHDVFMSKCKEFSIVGRWEAASMSMSNESVLLSSLGSVRLTSTW